jgi:hypothetical protein
MTDYTPKQILEEEFPKRFAAKADLIQKLNAVIVFDIRGEQGGKWTLDATKPSPSITAGTDGTTPKMTMIATDTDFVALATGKLNPTSAAMNGKLKFKPFDMSLALKLGELLA